MAKYYTFFGKRTNKIIGVVKGKEEGEEILRQRNGLDEEIGVIIESDKKLDDDVVDELKELSKHQYTTSFEGITLFQSEEDVEYLYFPEAVSNMYTVFEEASVILNFIKFTEEEEMYINFLNIKLQEYIGELESEEFENIDRCWGPSLDSNKLALQMVKEFHNPEEARKHQLRETID